MLVKALQRSILLDLYLLTYDMTDKKSNKSKEDSDGLLYGSMKAPAIPGAITGKRRPSDD